jgi:hypothetical protein
MIPYKYSLAGKSSLCVTLSGVSYWHLTGASESLQSEGMADSWTVEPLPLSVSTQNLHVLLPAEWGDFSCDAWSLTGGRAGWHHSTILCGQSRLASLPTLCSWSQWASFHHQGQLASSHHTLVGQSNHMPVQVPGRRTQSCFSMREVAKALWTSFICPIPNGQKSGQNLHLLSKHYFKGRFT